MKKLIVYPSDPMKAYLEKGQTYEYYGNYFNPGGFFDEVYAISPWGDNNIEKHANVTYIKASPLKFKKIIKEIKPTVVRAYGGYHCADWLALSQTQEIPTVVSVHDTNLDLIYNSIKYADNIICMSQSVQDAVRAKIDCSEKGEYIMGNRIDINIFSQVSDTSYYCKLNERFGNGRHVLHVGRKSNQKNLDTLIRAIPLLPDDVSVIFVGRGDFGPYERLATEMGVQNRIFNVEQIDNFDLPKWYSWCDCFCTPSRWEGFGLVFIEAASCKSPIVTSDIGPMNEYLTNNKDAILVRDYENPLAIADALLRVLEKKVDVDCIKDEARKVGERFEKSIIDKKEIDIYKEIIDRGLRFRTEVPIWEKIKLGWKYRQY